MKRATYGCFLSDLTGFMGFHCTGPGDCHKSVLQSHVLYYTALWGKSNMFVFSELVGWWASETVGMGTRGWGFGDGVVSGTVRQ